MKQTNYTKYLKQLIDKMWINVESNEIINSFVMDFEDIISINKYPNNLNDLKILYKDNYNETFPYEFIELSNNTYLSNSYIQNIKPLEFKDKHYKLSYKSFKKYQPILINDIDLDDKSINLGFFSEDNLYKYLSIEKNNDIWMEITPHEINTMNKSIEEANGNVLIMGLGLGYYAYMISNKDDVKSITVIEKDPKIIEIFNKYIFPFFNHKEKIKIIESDALKYQASINIDYCFIDLWHDGNDAIPLYIELVKQENNITKYSYWLENSIIEIMNRYIICILGKEIIDRDYNYKLIKKLIKKVEINSIETLNYYLTKDGIKELIKMG